jgi:hypothetical protein
MRLLILNCVLGALVAVTVAQPSLAEIVYTQTNVSITVGGSSDIDLNRDGIADFTVKSKLIQAYCQLGDEYVWSLSVIPATWSGVVVAPGNTWSDYASALRIGALIGSHQSFYPSSSIMAEVYWGTCSSGSAGQWLNQHGRYLGFQFQGTDNVIHYGWAMVSNAVYLDGKGHLQTATVLSGYAYETIAGQEIQAGQMSE